MSNKKPEKLISKIKSFSKKSPRLAALFKQVCELYTEKELEECLQYEMPLIDGPSPMDIIKKRKKTK